MSLDGVGFGVYLMLEGATGAHPDLVRLRRCSRRLGKYRFA
jgi:hypothetical protein